MNSISRECIECDGGCGRRNPKFNCSRCYATYYCSSKCQKMHWKAEHSQECQAMADLKPKPSTSSETKSNDSECAICLSKTMIHHIVLDCQHSCCRLCMQNYQRRMAPNMLGQPTGGCPLCHEPTTGEDASIRRVHLLTTRATHAPNPEDRTAYLQEATTLIAMMIEQDPTNLNNYFTQAELQLMKNTPREALATLKKLRELNSEGSDNAKFVNDKLDRVKALSEAGEDDEAAIILEELEDFTNSQSVSRFTYSVDAELLLAQAQEESEEWTDAIDTYRGILAKMENPSDGTPAQQRQVFMGFSRCFYMVGDYEKAIGAGEAAIEMNRHFPGVYKHVALAHQKRGDWETARTVMSRAVLYETPWDHENRQKAYDLWLELQNIQTP